MSYVVDFVHVSTAGLEKAASPQALAGLRANEARYLANKHNYQLAVTDASQDQVTVDYVTNILATERGIHLEATPLQTARVHVDGIDWTYVFYADGLGVNVLYTIDDPKKRAVGFKLSEGMEVPAALSDFNFAHQKSKLAGVIRGSYFVIKGEYVLP
ncbi:MAG: phage tail protein [Propionibacteriaceae bacterium]|jgi:hypothetical protein|nr:phage tail protein [Propionibacteriaceae bacterium]